jgi:two-component system LytT family sensor kinase
MRLTFPRLRSFSFWHYQITGWLIFWIADFILMALQPLPSQEFAVEALETPLAFALSLLLRLIYRRVKHRNLPILAVIGYIAFWSLVFTVIWYAGIASIWHVTLGPSYSIPMLDYRAAIRWINYLVPIWLGWSSLYFGIKYWRDWEEEKDRARKAVALVQRARLQMLRYQLNPHFLFNALNSVRALIQEDKKHAKEMITELSEFLRYSLVHRDHNDVPLREELGAIRHYLSIEKKRFEDKLQVTFNIDREAEEYPILSFLIHPLVENAIKYGMKTSTMPLRIRIEAALHDGNLQVVVANSGSWLPAPEDGRGNLDGTGTGLTNVRMRLENAYPDRHRFAVEHDGCVGVRIEIYKEARA